MSLAAAGSNDNLAHKAGAFHGHDLFGYETTTSCIDYGCWYSSVVLLFTFAAVFTNRPFADVPPSTTSWLLSIFTNALPFIRCPTYGPD